MKIHPTAIVHPRAELGTEVEISPMAQIGEHVTIGARTQIGPGAIITGWTSIGSDCDIHPGAIIGHEPQIKGCKVKRSYTKIGDHNIIREYVTIHRAGDEEGVTRIGNDNFIMANAHIAHNCEIGNEVIITNYAGLTGHVQVGDRAFISGLAAIHQFVRIGELAMIGGSSKVVQDVPPYFLVDGHPATACGLNTVGLKRAGIPLPVRNNLKKAYRLLYRSGLPLFSAALLQIEEELGECPEINRLVTFIRGSKRGICKERSQKSENRSQRTECRR